MDTTKYSPAAGLPSEEHSTVQASCWSFAEEQIVRHSTWIPPDIWISYLGINSTVRRSAQISQITDQLLVSTLAMTITKHRQA